MSGSKSPLHILGVLVIGFFLIFVIKLIATGELSLYVHPRYTWFAGVMAVIGLIVLLGGYWYETRHHTANDDHGKLSLKITDIVVIAVLILAFVVPSQVLSSTTTSKKALNTPQTPLMTSQGECPPINEAWTLQTWIYYLGNSPAHCYENEPITLTGSILESSNSPLPSGVAYVGRIVVSCCVIDARPYALPVAADTIANYPLYSWVKIKGNLKLRNINGNQLFVIVPTTITKIDKPGSNYDYLAN